MSAGVATINPGSYHHEPVCASAFGALSRLDGWIALRRDHDLSTPQERMHVMEPSQAVLDGFATVTRLLRASRPVEYQATESCFKVHLPGKPGWSVCRLVDFDGEHPAVLVPLAAEQVTNLVPLLETVPLGPQWSRIVLMGRNDLRVIGPALCAAWDARSDASASGGQEDEPLS